MRKLKSIISKRHSVLSFGFSQAGSQFRQHDNLSVSKSMLFNLANFASVLELLVDRGLLSDSMSVRELQSFVFGIINKIDREEIISSSDVPEYE